MRERQRQVGAVFVTLILLSSMGCSKDAPEPKAASLADIGSDPSDYQIGRELIVTGWLIEPPRSVLFICDEISEGTPPRAIGACSEVENKGLLKEVKVTEDKETTWVPDRVRLRCTVAGHWPSRVRPERLSFTCLTD